MSGPGGHPLSEVRDIARRIWKDQKVEIITQTLD